MKERSWDLRDQESQGHFTCMTLSKREKVNGREGEGKVFFKF